MSLYVMLASAGPWYENPEIWVLLSFVAFLGVLVYMGVPGMLNRGLDSRAERIRSELDEAKRLRQEAQELLADYQRKAAKAEDEAQKIISRAEDDAKRLAEETRKSLQETLERRTQLAEEKIERAEAQAVTEVRAAAVERAVAAAQDGIRNKVGSGSGTKLIEDAIDSLPAKLN